MFLSQIFNLLHWEFCPSWRVHNGHTEGPASATASRNPSQTPPHPSALRTPAFLAFSSPQFCLSRSGRPTALSASRRLALANKWRKLWARVFVSLCSETFVAHRLPLSLGTSFHRCLRRLGCKGRPDDGVATGAEHPGVTHFDVSCSLFSFDSKYFLIDLVTCLTY